MIWESQNWLKMALQLLIGHLILHSTLPNDTKKFEKKKKIEPISHLRKFQVPSQYPFKMIEAPNSLLFFFFQRDIYT